LNKLRATLDSHHIEAVIHFAGRIDVAESMREPQKYYETNVVGTLALLDAMRQCGVHKIVFSSSAAVYGVPERVPIDEESTARPINPYGRTKLMVERLLGDYGQAYALKYVGLRYFNASGADLGGEIGEEHRPETHLIPRALMAATGQLPHLDIFGDDYETPDGTCIRDYVHVDDLARGHLAALDYLDGGGVPCSVNLGSGSGTSVRQIIDVVERVSGRAVPTKMSARRPGDPAILLADPQKAQRLLGFATEHSDIETIVGSAWAFHSRRKFAPAGKG
jgi:UDP-arabinose 4-epimerase